VDFLVASSFGAGKESSGSVRLLYDPETRLEGKHILLVEDIIDTGTTLRRLLSLLSARSPRSLSVCALLDKGLMTERPPEIRFIGFQAPKAFLVGYGLDHAEDFRHLPFIADLS
jgi:hypoxanthine phosphoribosyltransferase